MNPASRALRLPLRLSRQQLWMRPQYPPSLSAHAAYIPIRSRQYQLLHSFSSAFSTHAVRTQKAKPQEPDPGVFIPTAMSWESIGIGKNMKRLVILMASLTAMLELFIWCETTWNWWKGEEGDKLE